VELLDFLAAVFGAAAAGYVLGYWIAKGESKA
jgi:hypothetical protein